MTPTPFTATLDALAVARLTQLILNDGILQRPRHWLIKRSLRKSGTHPVTGWAFFLTCPWCPSIWLAAAATTARYLTPNIWSPIAYSLALAAVAAVLVGRLGT